MSEIYEQVKERILRYVKIDTQSLANQPFSPSTQKQFDLARVLRDELIAMGASNVWMDEKECITYGTVPSTLPEGGGLSVGYIAHLDTTPDISGTNVKPWVLENYQGGDILLNKEQNIVMDAKTYPVLNNYIGQDLVLTDGTTLLGGDDKSAIADIMTMVEFMLRHPEIPHGPIQVAFTPDEEVAGGARGLDLARFGADVAYTVDGAAVGIVNYETFNATEAQVTVHGLNVHPGRAKDIMVNSLEIGSQFLQMLPAFERAQTSEGREGYYHPFVFDGKVEKTFIRTLLRDHEVDSFEARKAYVRKCVAELNRIYGEGTVELNFANSYWSMRQVVAKVPFMVDYLHDAIRSCGVEPQDLAMRGGTDGAQLSQRGLPCPNLSAGYELGHSRFEFASLQAMEKTVEILIALVKLYGDRKPELEK